MSIIFLKNKKREFNFVFISLIFIFLLINLISSYTDTQLVINTKFFLKVIIIFLFPLFLYINIKKLKEVAKEEKNKKYSKNSKQIFLFSTFLITAFLIRLYNLGNLSLWFDEAITSKVVSHITENGIPKLYNLYYWRGITYHYLVTFLVFIFENNEFWLRLPSVLSGMGIIIVTYIIGRRTNFLIGLGCLLFLTFSPFNISFSRFARFYILNAFLFVGILLTIYKGFFENYKKYQYLTIFLAILMVHTTQIGAFFIFGILSYLILAFIKKINWEYLDPLNKKNKFLHLFLENKRKSILIIILLLISGIGNFLKRFLGLRLQKENIFNYYIKKILSIKNESLKIINQPDTYPLLKFPDWWSITFFNQHHIPIIFLGISFLFTIGIIIFKKKKNKKWGYFEYINLTLILSILGYEVLNRNIKGARLYLIFEALLVYVTISSFYFLLKLTSIKKKREGYLLFSCFVLLILGSIKPPFSKIINTTYGENMKKNPFKNNHCATFRADLKTPYTYTNKKIRKKDLLITLVSDNPFYLNKKPDYIIDQSIDWKDNKIQKNNNYFHRNLKSQIINKTEKLKKIIENNPKKRVWVIVNARQTKNPCTQYLTKEMKEFLKSNKKNIIYTSPDGVSKVYLFNNSIK